METNIRVNDRQDSNQLSDKIIDSSQELFQVYLSEDAVQKVLMKGEMTKANKTIAHRLLKGTGEYMDNLGHVLDNLKNFTEDQNERQFFDMCGNGLRRQASDYIKRWEQMVGKVDHKFLDTPMSQPMFNINTFQLYTSTQGLMRGVVPILATLILFPRVMAYLQQNPNYVDNELTKMLLFNDVDVSPVIEQLRRMIDNRADQVSDEEVAVLCELFQRDLVYELHLLRHEFSEMKWFEI